MLRNRLYYRIKPLVPRNIRLTIRRQIVLRRRKNVHNVWPILPGSEQVPPGWTGWPDGKKFALVLTHDVESQRGLDRCLQLMNLEKSLGLRSSFNLIPEGDYRSSSALRSELSANGFEVGVHDFRHDGKLYQNRSEFIENARRINQYLKEWNAVGFRSGFMLRNLNWLHDLNIDYDASTFDTDPFEPQPDGVATIFPFWIPRPETNGYNQPSLQSSNCAPGYVELPYTLPQDSTLFLLFREPDFAVWKRKLGWIVQHGGMALLDTHPDYMRFNGSVQDATEYPADRYRDFLKYVQAQYRGQYWLATPKELAAWYRENQRSTMDFRNKATHSSLTKKKAVAVLYSYYPSDPRPRRAAEALVEAGMEVDMICLRQKDSEPANEKINGVNVRRVPLRRRRNSKMTYLLQYGSFIAASMAILARRSVSRRYDLIHVHNMPDVLAFSGIIPKLRGARIILDLHDPMPELMRTIFNLKETSFAVQLLKKLEKASIAFADHVITVNTACKKIFSARSCSPEKIQVVMNAPDERIFKFARYEAIAANGHPRPFVLMFHGSIVERHGLDLAVQAVQILETDIPEIELRIYGASTPFLESVLVSVKNLKLENRVRYFGPKTLEEIAAAIRDCDLGVIPNRRSVFTEINTPTRIFEYLALGKPVIAPRVPGITDYFESDDLIFFELGNAADLARQIQAIHDDPARTANVVTRGQIIYQEHCWTSEKRKFIGRVETLLAGK